MKKNDKALLERWLRLCGPIAWTLIGMYVCQLGTLDWWGLFIILPGASIPLAITVADLGDFISPNPSQYRVTNTLSDLLGAFWLGSTFTGGPSLIGALLPNIVGTPRLGGTWVATLIVGELIIFLIANNNARKLQGAE